MASESGGSDDWCTIESDPGVFTEVLEEIGCSKVELQELWTLDDDSLSLLCEDSGNAVYGLIFLFQYNSPSKEQSSTTPKKSSSPLAETDIPSGLFFAHQVTTNACATQAILSVVLNHSSNIELGSTLQEFHEFTTSFPPSLKGVAISSSEPIKKAHNAFGRTDTFFNDGKYYSHHRSAEDVFHFVAYIPFTDPTTNITTVYELDGLQSGPIPIGAVPETEEASSAKPSAMPWLSVARTAIQERMNDSGNVKFNLMAVMQDKRIALREKLQQLESLSADNSAVSGDISSFQYQLEMEQIKRTKWKLENQRRRHNYVPLCVSILKELAKLPAKKKQEDSGTSSTTTAAAEDSRLSQLIASATEKKQREYQEKRTKRK